MLGDLQKRWEEGVKSFGEEDVCLDQLVDSGLRAQQGWDLRENRSHGQRVLHSCSGYEQRHEKRPVVV
jgi:hypothetical protein